MEQARVDLFRVLPETLPFAWPVLAPMLQPAVDLNSGEFNINDTLFAVAHGTWQLWTIVQDAEPVAALVTEIIQYPQRKIARIILLGGVEFNDWKHLISKVEDWALIEECTMLEALVRPGMEKRAREIGFQEKCRVVVKDLRGKLQ